MPPAERKQRTKLVRSCGYRVPRSTSGGALPTQSCDEDVRDHKVRKGAEFRPPTSQPAINLHELRQFDISLETSFAFLN